MSGENLVPKLRFSGFVDEWKSIKLNETGEVVTGATPPTKNKDNFTNSGYIWVTPGDIDSKKIVSKTERNLSEKGLEKGRKIESNSILVTCIGATIGKICMIKEVGSCNQQLNAITPNEHFFPDFIYYTIQKTAKNLLLIAGNTATPILNKKSFGNLSYNFPSFAEQKKIALFIDKIDRKIDLLEKKYETYQDFKKYLMQQIFAQKLRFAEFDDEWKPYKIGDISKTYSGGTPPTSKREYYEGDIPFIKSGEINKEVTEQYITEDAINNSSAKRVQKGDLLLALYGATSGEVAISKINGAINQAVLKIENDMDNYFQYCYFLMYKDQIVHKYLQGGQGNLSANIIKKLEFKYPSLAEQKKISQFFMSIENKLELYENKIQKFNYFKKGLLQQMFV